MTFTGVNIDAGDSVRWVPAASVGCSTRDLPTGTFTAANADDNGRVEFRLSQPGLYVLCYKWRYAADAYQRASVFIRFPNIRLAVVSIFGEGITPRGTALGCVTRVTVPGLWFDLLEGLPLSCRYGTATETWPITTRTNTTLTCETPSVTVADSQAVRLILGGHVFEVLESFEFISLASVRIDSALPAGGLYNGELPVVLKGGSFVDFGGARCSFGEFVGPPATVISSSHAICPKPAFPDAVRDLVGDYTLSYSPNGQCFTATAVNPQGVATFSTFNALLRTLDVTGSPSDTSVQIGLLGSGFIDLPGSICTFTRTGSAAIARNASFHSGSRMTCSSPGGGIANAEYQVSLQLNGVTDTPDMGAVGGTLTFTEYDLSAVRISSIFPPGGVTGELTAITLQGSGFANYGHSQLICRIRQGGQGLTTRISASMLGTRGDSIRCPYFAPPVPDADLVVELSLNNGTAGTFCVDEVPFVVYEHARVSGIVPTSGDANGGNTVTIFGRGFTALSPSPTTRSSFLRCKFGSEVQKQPPSWHNDTAVVCTSTWGKEAPAGQVVSVALNSRAFFSSAGAARYVFVGLHRPALVEAYFRQDANALIVRFDAQATNKANMNGVGLCTLIFDDRTVQELGGGALTSPLCEWTDGSTVKVQLNLYTAAAPGMTVGIRAGVLWPAAWPYSGSCEVDDSMCAAAQSTTVDSNYPCDLRDTPDIESCVQPVALIQAPVSISSCPGTAIILDGSRSHGSGIKSLRYQWGVDPTRSDRSSSIQPAVSSCALPLALCPFTLNVTWCGLSICARSWKIKCFKKRYQR